MSIRAQTSPLLGFVSKASWLIRKASEAIRSRQPKPKETHEGFLGHYERMLSEVVRLTIPRDF